MENIKALEVTALCKKYGDKQVLDNVSFSVDYGEVVGFLGPNGAGKSTTMNIITGYLSSTKGQVKVCGVDNLLNPKEAKQNIGYLPEIPPLYYDMTVYEYLCFVYELKKCTLDKKKHIAECMALVKIVDVAHRMIKNLSKGYKQRVGLAQALIGDPDVLILDEPTVGLDPSQILEIRKVIKHISKKKTIILSTHILQEVTAVCDKVIIINHGRIMACDSLKNLENSGDTYTIKVKGSRSEAASVLRSAGINFLNKKTDEIDVAEFVAYGSDDCDVREVIFNAFAKANMILLELHQDSKSIEDVFREYTSDEIKDIDYTKNNVEEDIK